MIENKEETQANDRVIADNKTIAEFMGWVHHEDAAYDKYEMANLKYHTSWDALIAVVEKIESIENGRFGFTIDPWGMVVIDYANNENEIYQFVNDDKYPKIQQYYETVTAFIKWLNSISDNKK